MARIAREPRPAHDGLDPTARNIPSIGLAPVLVQRVLATAREINRRFGTAIILVEQNIKTALGVADRAYVMKSGRIVLEKPAGELLANPASWWELY